MREFPPCPSAPPSDQDADSHDASLSSPPVSTRTKKGKIKKTQPTTLVTAASLSTAMMPNVGAGATPWRVVEDERLPLSWWKKERVM